MSPLGDVVIDGTLNESQNIAYIPELFGDIVPHEEFRRFVTCSISPPGYGEAKLSPDCKGKMLTWKEYGKCLAKALEEIKQPLTLLGNSKGAMIALYTAVLVPNLVNHLILYRIPRFGSIRNHLQEKYLGIAQSMTGEAVFSEFLDAIRENTSPTILKNLRSNGWEKSKKLYEGASVSELDSTILHHLIQPVFLIDNDCWYDKLHPKQSLELLYNLFPNQNVQKISDMEDAVLNAYSISSHTN